MAERETDSIRPQDLGGGVGRDASATSRCLDGEIVRSTDVAIIGIGTDFAVRTWNPGATRLFGYTRDEMIGHLQTQLCPEDHLRTFHSLILAAQENGSAQADVECHHRDGHRLDILVNVSALRSIDGTLEGYGIVAHDISSRKRVEKALRSAHDTFRDLVEQSPFGVYVIDADFRIAHVSEGARKAFENVHPLIGTKLDDALRVIWTEPFASEAIARFRDTLETGSPYRTNTTTEPRRDTGDVESYDWKIERVLLPDLRFGVVCHFYDLSERERAERALEEGAALAIRLAKITDSVPGAICSFRLNPDGRTGSFPYAAARFLDVYGIAPEEVREDAAPVFSRIRADDLPGVMESVAASARELTTWHAEFRYQHPVKGEVWIEGHSSPVPEPGGSIVWHGYLQDITRRKSAESELARVNSDLERRVEERTAALAEEMQRRALAQEALARSQRLEAVGRLAGGLAHDFNNALTAISANLELAEMRIEDPRALAALRRALDAVELSASLNRRLLTFAPRGKTFKSVLSVNERISSLMTLLERTLGQDIAFEMDLDQDLWSAKHDPVELDSAVLNLAINARDAMPDGGHIRITTSNVRILDGQSFPGCSTPLSGDYVRITLCDDGHGMSPAVLARAAEPFYTTKANVRGTGLGLSSVRDFAEASGGALAIESREGVGTCVSIYLPRATETAVTETSSARSGDPVELGDGELVLLVEDNEQVLQTTHEMLEGLGYAVQDACGGAQAMEAMSQHSFDLVFSDIKMPGGISGYDIARWVLKERPATKVVLTTGFNDERPAGDGLLDRVVVLRKPYTRGQLAAELRKALVAAQ